MENIIVKVNHLQMFAEGEESEVSAATESQSQNASQPEGVENRYGEWIRQAESAKKIYPNLDLAQEVKNPQFARMLKAGLDVATAYLVTHQHRIIPGAMQYGVRAAEERIANRIAANSVRPVENGIGAQSAAIMKPDVSRMTKADRQQIARRVAAGERIVF